MATQQGILNFVQQYFENFMT